ncbi:MAG: thioredoxin [Clostridia bacterium]|nr:thioredoxin [Clostridia bacterium]
MAKQTVTVTVENFKQLILENEKPALVDFWAPWCGPCRMVGPIIDELAEELEGDVIVGKVNVDEQPDLAAAYGVMSIPTIILFKDGDEADRVIGAKSKEALLEFLGK